MRLRGRHLRFLLSWDHWQRQGRGTRWMDEVEAWRLPLDGERHERFS